MGNNVKLIRPLYIVEYVDRRELFDDDGYMQLLRIHRLCVNAKSKKEAITIFHKRIWGCDRCDITKCKKVFARRKL